MRDVETYSTEALRHSFLCGKKKGLGKKRKDAYKRLNLLHLFTPSGLHLSSVSLLFNPLKKYFPLIISLIQLGIFSFSLTAMGLNSIHRLAKLKMMGTVLSYFKIRIDYFYLFLMVFTYEFLLGNYKNSPLSFAYSFLFIGIVFTSFKRSYLDFSLALFAGQIMAAVVGIQKVNLLSFFVSFVITAFFGPLFFLIVLEVIFERIDFLISVNDFLISSFDQLILWISEFIKSSDHHPGYGLFFVVIFFILKRKVLFFVFLLIYSSPIYNFKLTIIKNLPTYEVSVDKKFLNIKETKKRKDYILIKTEDESCRLRILPTGKQIKCKKLVR